MNLFDLVGRFLQRFGRSFSAESFFQIPKIAWTIFYINEISIKEAPPYGYGQCWVDLLVLCVVCKFKLCFALFVPSILNKFLVVSNTEYFLSIWEFVCLVVHRVCLAG